MVFHEKPRELPCSCRTLWTSLETSGSFRENVISEACTYSSSLLSRAGGLSAGPLAQSAGRGCDAKEEKEGSWGSNSNSKSTNSSNSTNSTHSTNSTNNSTTNNTTNNNSNK